MSGPVTNIKSQLIIICPGTNKMLINLQTCFLYLVRNIICYLLRHTVLRVIYTYVIRYIEHQE